MLKPIKDLIADVVNQDSLATGAKVDLKKCECAQEWLALPEYQDGQQKKRKG